MGNIIMNEAPVNESDFRVELSVVDGDGLATLTASKIDEETEQVTGVVSSYMNEDDLYELAMSATRALAALGDTKRLAMLTRDVADTLTAHLI